MRQVDSFTAASDIPDGATLVVAGNGSLLLPELVLQGIAEVYARQGRPEGLRVIYPVVSGTGPGTGVDHFAHPGLVREVISSTFDIWGIDRLVAMIQENRVKAHCLPMGVLFQLLRAAAAGQPGLLTRIGLDTFLDPAVHGTGYNEITTESLAQRLTLDGEEWLYYRSPQIQVAILRASVADEDGNLSLYQEPLWQTPLEMAMAARAGGGKVIAQVKRLVRRGSLPPRLIDVPGFLVDDVVVDPEQRQSVESEYDPALTGELKVVLDGVSPALTPAKVMARRVALFLRPGMVINLGFGIPSLVAEVAVEEGIYRRLTLTVEHGPAGGMPTGTRTFGASVSPDFIFHTDDMFALYHSGQLDLSVLSAAEVDREGNVNASRFANGLRGPGGYVDISGGVRRLIVTATLTTGGGSLRVDGGGTAVVAEGRNRKFVGTVRERTFSAKEALHRGAEVIYVTDRGSFRLTPQGLELFEIAPGIDLQRDILGQMEFTPLVARKIELWPRELYREGPMGLAERWGSN